MNCPYCDHELDERVVTVSGETVVDVLEIWLEEGDLATTRQSSPSLLALSVLCVIAWMRDAANDWRKDVP